MGKIALVHDFLFTYGGAERVLSIFHELYPEAPIYTLFADEKLVKTHYPNARIVTSYLQKSWLKRFPPLLLASFPRAIESFDLSEYDTVLSSSGAFSHGVITGAATTHISYCHTPMRYAWDWHHEYLKERGITRPISLFIARSILSRLRVWDAVSAKRVDRYLANSGVVASRIAKFYRQSAQVVYPPIDTKYFNPQHVKPRKESPYAISASRLSPNKRINLMIEASSLTKFPLRIIGGGAQEQALKQLAEKLQAPVTFLGRISEEEKRQQIGNADCFLFTAEDDFGIGPAEALSLGVPVLSIARGGIQEVIQPGKNGMFFTHPTKESLAEALIAFEKTGVSYSPAQIHQSVSHLGVERFKDQIRKAVAHA